MGDMGDNFRAFRDYAKERKEKRREKNTRLIKDLANKYDLDLHWFTEYHVRVLGPDKPGSYEVETFDYYPTSGRVVYENGPGPSGTDLEAWLRRIFLGMVSVNFKTNNREK